MLRKLYNWLAGVEPLPVEETIAFKVMLETHKIGTLSADILAGWVLTTLWVGGLTGLVKT